VINLDDKPISEVEYQIVQLVRQLRPYHVMEIAVNQDGTKLSVTVQPKNKPTHLTIESNFLIKN